MKNIAIIISAMFLLSACDNFLDVKPKAEIVEYVYFDKPEGFEDALYGVYSALESSTLYGENLSWGMLDAFAQYYRKDLPTESAVNLMCIEHEKLKGIYSGIWSSTYESIGYVNNILRNLDKKNENSMHWYKLYKGEALGLRAYLHFDLMRLFAPHIASQPAKEAIPYVTVYEAMVSPFKTVEEVYDLVLKDLKEAEALLGEDSTLFVYPRRFWIDEGFATCREIHFNLYAAQALLARVYWMKGDLENALVYAQKVIDSDKFPLEDKLNLDQFVAGRLSSKETIFGIYTTGRLESIKNAFYTYEPTYTWLPDDDVLQLYTVPQEYGSDMRQSKWFRVPENVQDTSILRCMKIVNEKKIISSGSYAPGSGTIEGINMIRIPEMYLICAEALLEKNPEEAQKYFDALIEARGLFKYADRTGQTPLSLEDIIEERRKEFLQEGQYFFTLKRMNANIKVNYLDKELEGSDALYTLLIPEEEFEYRYTEDDEE